MSGRLILKGATCITPFEVIERALVRIEDGRITEVCPGEALSGARGACRPGAAQDAESPQAHHVREIALDGFLLCPGFIDLHFHGAYGIGVEKGLSERIHALLRRLLERGTTALLFTVIERSPDRALELLREVRDVVDFRSCPRVLGVHLEGPFVNRLNRAALPEGWVVGDHCSLQDKRLLASRLVEACGGTLRIVTIAPEVDPSFELAGLFLSAGANLALGHTNATYDEVMRAFRQGYSHVTHLYNAMRAFHHREPGPVGAVLESGLPSAELVCDGVHVHPAAIRLAREALGSGKLVFVTDSTKAAGLTDGIVDFYGDRIMLRDNKAVLEDGRLGGSLLDMRTALVNSIRSCGFSFQEALLCASTNPARVLGVDDDLGSIEVGKLADIVALDQNLDVKLVIVNGELVFDAR